MRETGPANMSDFGTNRTSSVPAKKTLRGTTKLSGDRTGTCAISNGYKTAAFPGYVGSGDAQGAKGPGG